MRAKQSLIVLLSVFALSQVFVSCSTSVNIAKKRHSNGYHISVSKDVKADYKAAEATTVEKVKATDLSLTSSKDLNVESLSAAKLNQEATTSTPLKVEAATAKAIVETAKETKMSKLQMFKAAKKVKKLMKKESSSAPSKGVLYLLAFFIPIVAVGLATDWDLNKLLINLLWTLLCGFPAIIHAFIVVKNNA